MLFYWKITKLYWIILINFYFWKFKLKKILRLDLSIIGFLSKKKLIFIVLLFIALLELIENSQ